MLSAPDDVRDLRLRLQMTVQRDASNYNSYFQFSRRDRPQITDWLLRSILSGRPLSPCPFNK